MDHPMIPVKQCSRAGTGCGGCEPEVKTILKQELEKLCGSLSNHLCEHFHYSRPELMALIRTDPDIHIFGKIWVKLDSNQDMPMVKHSVPSSPVSDRHGVVMAFKIPSPLPSVLKIDRRESALHIK